MKAKNICSVSVIHILLFSILLAWIFFCISILYTNWQGYFPSYSADGQTRAVLGAKWIKKPFLLNNAYSYNSVWLPLQYWLVGVGLTIFYDLYWTPIIINLIFSAGVLYLLYRITLTFINNRFAGAIGILLALFFPGFVWLSISGMAEPVSNFFIVGTFLFYFKWINDLKRMNFLLYAYLMQFFGNMARVENWIFSVFFAIATIIILLRDKTIAENHKSKIFFLILVLPWIFVVIWESAQFYKFRTLFLYYNVVKKETMAIYGLSFKKGLMKAISTYLTTYPLALILSLIETAYMAVKKFFPGVLYFLGVLLYSFFLLLRFPLGVIPAPMDRSFVIVSLLLIPLAAKLVYDFSKFKKIHYAFKVSILAVIFVILTSNFFRCYAFPYVRGDLPETMCLAGQQLKLLWKQGLLAEKDIVLIKMHKSDDGIFCYNVIAAYSNHPLNIKGGGGENINLLIKDAKAILIHPDDMRSLPITLNPERIYEIKDYVIVLLKS